MPLFQLLDSLFMGLRNARESPDVFAVFVREILEFLDVPEGEFQVHGQGFNSFIYSHDPLILNYQFLVVRFSVGFG